MTESCTKNYQNLRGMLKCYNYLFYSFKIYVSNRGNGNLVTDPPGMLRLWRKYFSTLLQGDDDTNIAFRHVVPNAIEDDSEEISPPSHEDIKIALCILKTVKRQVLMTFPLNCLRPGVMSS